MHKIEINAYNFDELPEHIQENLIEQFPAVDEDKLFDLVAGELNSLIKLNNEQLCVDRKFVYFTGDFVIQSVVDIVRDAKLELPKQIIDLHTYLIDNYVDFWIVQDMHSDTYGLLVKFEFHEIALFAEQDKDTANKKLTEILNSIKYVLQRKVDETQFYLTTYRDNIITETTEYYNIKKILSEDKYTYYDLDGHIVYIEKVSIN